MGVTLVRSQLLGYDRGLPYGAVRRAATAHESAQGDPSWRWHATRKTVRRIEPRSGTLHSTATGYDTQESAAAPRSSRLGNRRRHRVPSVTKHPSTGSTRQGYTGVGHPMQWLSIPTMALGRSQRTSLAMAPLTSESLIIEEPHLCEIVTVTFRKDGQNLIGGGVSKLFWLHLMQPTAIDAPLTQQCL